MKELEIIKHDIVKVNKAEEKKQQHIGTIRIKKGHKLYCVKNGKAFIPEIEETEILLNAYNNIEFKSKCIIEPSVFFCSALNEKSAVKQWKRKNTQ